MFNRFTPFKSFNPPDLVRGPFKTLKKHREKKRRQHNVTPQTDVEKMGLKFLIQKHPVKLRDVA